MSTAPEREAEEQLYWERKHREDEATQASFYQSEQFRGERELSNKDLEHQEKWFQLAHPEQTKPLTQRKHALLEASASPPPPPPPTHIPWKQQASMSTPDDAQNLWDLAVKRFPNAPSNPSGIMAAIESAMQREKDLRPEAKEKPCTHVEDLRQILKAPDTETWAELLTRVEKYAAQLILLPAPPRFDGSIPKFPAWKEEVKRFIAAEHTSFRSAASAAAWTLSLLEGTAADLTARWNVEDLVSEDPSPRQVVQTILSDLGKTFVDPQAKSKATLELKQLRQGTTPFQEFLVQFESLASIANIEGQEKVRDLIASINSDLRMVMRTYVACLATPMNLEELDFDEFTSRALRLEPTVPKTTSSTPTTKGRNVRANTAPVAAPLERFCQKESFDTAPAVPEILRRSLKGNPKLRELLVQDQLCFRCRRPRSEHKNERFSAGDSGP